MHAPRTIAFIGTGVMGRSMAAHLLDAGHSLHVHNRSRHKAEPLLERGALWYASAGEAAAQAEIVFTMLGYPSDVEATYLAPGGILERAQPGTLLIDMTTSSPELARRIAGRAALCRLEALDAPVSGGDIGAREARLSIMVGGTESAFESALPLLQRLGKNILHHGPAGSGQHCKMANQIAVALGTLAWAEALAYAKRSGLCPESVHQSISAGAAGSWGLTHLAPRAMSGDFAPGFYVKHLLKDLRIALQNAEETHLELPGLALAAQLYQRLLETGASELGTQAIYRLYLES
ncbi:MAG: 2-hydroxy-3-oxopropionate reductase [Verrucomicrobiota bacterium]